MKRLLVALFSLSMILPVYAAKNTDSGKPAATKKKQAKSQKKKKAPAKKKNSAAKKQSSQY